MKHLILLLLILSSLDIQAKRKEKDLDKLMEIQLSENSKLWEGSRVGTDSFHSLDPIKKNIDSLGYFMTNSPYSRCITKLSDLKYRRPVGMYYEILADTLPDSSYQIHLGSIIDWVWLGDINPIYIDVFKCNNPVIEQYVQKKLVLDYNKMTILHKSYNIPMFRIDTINGETVVKSAMFDGYSENHIYEVAKRNKKYIKGITVINGVTVFLFGNAIKTYFDAVDRDVVMQSPLPPHKSNYRRIRDGAVLFTDFHKVEHVIYIDGKLRKRKIKIDNPLTISARSEWNKSDDFIIDDLFLGVTEEIQKSKGLNITSAEDLFDRNMFNARISRF